MKKINFILFEAQFIVAKAGIQCCFFVTIATIINKTIIFNIKNKLYTCRCPVFYDLPSTTR